MDLKEQLRNDAEQYLRQGWLNIAQVLMAAADRIHQLEDEQEASQHNLTPAMIQERNDQLNAENNRLRDRIKKLEAQTLEDSQELGRLDARIEALEDAADGLLEICEADETAHHISDEIEKRCQKYRAAKEAKP